MTLVSYKAMTINSIICSINYIDNMKNLGSKIPSRELKEITHDIKH